MDKATFKSECFYAIDLATVERHTANMATGIVEQRIYARTYMDADDLASALGRLPFIRGVTVYERTGKTWKTFRVVDELSDLPTVPQYDGPFDGEGKRFNGAENHETLANAEAFVSIVTRGNLPKKG